MIRKVKFTDFVKRATSPKMQLTEFRFHAYLSNNLTNLCIALYGMLLYCVVLNCIVFLIYCYADIIQYNAMHKFVGVLDNPQPARLEDTLL